MNLVGCHQNDKVLVVVEIAKAAAELPFETGKRRAPATAGGRFRGKSVHLKVDATNRLLDPAAG
jgi:hypothetical protein